MTSLLYFNNPELIKQFTVCKDYVNVLLSHDSETFKEKDIVKWFKELCELLANLIVCITKNVKELKCEIVKYQKEHVLLYLNQVSSTLAILIEVFVKENELQTVLKNCRCFAIKKLLCCLDGLLNIAKNNENSFIKWMDIAIDKVSEIDIDSEKSIILEQCKEVRSVIEEVLCHAMSIAQIATEEDCKIIKGSSQTVLEMLNTLVSEVNKDDVNKAMCNLYVDACNNKLCKLERHVNEAVLKLCLKVFCEYTKYLDNMYQHCLTMGAEQEFEDLVADFDLHVDRIMQISLFAVACSDDVKNGIKIRNRMANLEFLECELVPAFNAVKVSSSIENRTFALLLRDHWLREAKSLQKMIYLIIDPAAFVQVIYEKLKATFEDINDRFKSTNLLEDDDLKPFLQQGKILIDFVTVSKTEMSENEMKNLLPDFKDIKNVFNEINNANVLLKMEENNNARIIKRCKIFLHILKKFCRKLNCQNQDSDQSGDKIVSSDECNKIGNKFFDHILNRGKEILKDRSILYKTPQRKDSSIKLSTLKTKKEMPLSKLVHMRKLSFISAENQSQSLDLQITAILNELTNLKNSFSTQNVFE